MLASANGMHVQLLALPKQTKLLFVKKASKAAITGDGAQLSNLCTKSDCSPKLAVCFPQETKMALTHRESK